MQDTNCFERHIFTEISTGLSTSWNSHTLTAFYLLCQSIDITSLRELVMFTLFIFPFPRGQNNASRLHMFSTRTSIALINLISNVACNLLQGVSHRSGMGNWTPRTGYAIAQPGMPLPPFPHLLIPFICFPLPFLLTAAEGAIYSIVTLLQISQCYLGNLIALLHRCSPFVTKTTW